MLINRRTLYRPMQYEEGKRNGLPTMRLRFTSHEGERIVLSFEAFSPPTPEQGGFINPGNHSEDSSLPVMWANTSAYAHPSSQVTVEGIAYQLRPAPQPGALLFVYSEDFLIGVIREGQLGLWLAWAPKRVAVGERWLYWDNLHNLHQYEIIGIEGDVLTLHKTTTSSFLAEEILTVQRVEGQFLLRSIRNTGRLGRRQDVPPAPQGFTLRLSTEEGFWLSTDERENLVRGTTSRQVSGNRTTWTLLPMDPPGPKAARCEPASPGTGPGTASKTRSARTERPAPTGSRSAHFFTKTSASGSSPSCSDRNHIASQRLRSVASKCASVAARTSRNCRVAPMVWVKRWLHGVCSRPARARPGRRRAAAHRRTGCAGRPGLPWPRNPATPDTPWCRCSARRAPPDS
ncbi:hypothetical protein ACN28S_10995 [Cystobacter fuscus]